MKKLILWIGLAIGMFAALPLPGVPVNATRKAAAKAVEAAARRSGRVLTPAARIAMEKAACKAFAQYGDDVFRVLEKGGLEALKQGERHGKDFWKLCSHASPRAVRSLSLHADTLLPLAKRIGPDFMTLESRVPGLASECIRLFGDGSANTLRHAPAAEIKQLVGYARKADSPETVRLLEEAYRKSNGDVLKHLNWKHIMAGGLSAGVIITAYNLSGGVAELAESHPGHFVRLVDKWTWPIQAGLYFLCFLLCWQLYRIIVRSGKWLHSKIPEPVEEPVRENAAEGKKDSPEHSPEEGNETKEHAA